MTFSHHEIVPIYNRINKTFFILMNNGRENSYNNHNIDEISYLKNIHEQHYHINKYSTFFKNLDPSLNRKINYIGFGIGSIISSDE